MRARVIAIGVAFVGGLLGVAGAMAQSVETGIEYHQGRWTWNGVHKAKQDPNNVSRIQFTGPNTAVYCYIKKCWNVRTTDGTGGSYAFSTGGRNRFEFSPMGGSRTMARFWVAFGPNSQDPDATAIFTLKSGH